MGELREAGSDSDSEHLHRETLPCIQLAMKTKTFRRPCTADGDEVSLDVDDYTCSICLCEIEDGDRVGKLTCKHTFHADCLKQWLRRKNCCPLCLSAAIARPKLVERQSIQPDDSHDAMADS